ncbi:MAG: HK97-gp10 family putative phage morphogenesis protein [Gammaproteobacteria bacterium]
MTAFEISVNAHEKAAELRRFPALLEKYLRPAVDHSANVIALAAKRFNVESGAMAHSTLQDSITKEMKQSSLEAIVTANANYAPYVEEGTGAGGYPPRQVIIDWLRVKRIQPRNPDMTEDELAYLISRDIVFNGTPTKPFMEPAYQSEKEATFKRLDAAVDKAIAEMSA